MKIEIEQETLTPELADEMFALFQDYYARSKGQEGVPPLDFRWEVYFKLQGIGLLRIYTAREGGVLLGVNFYVVLEHPHYRGYITADCAGLSVHMDARGRSVGRQLVDYAARVLAEEGVHAMVHKARAVYDEKPLFDKLPEFKLVERTYQRNLNQTDAQGN